MPLARVAGTLRGVGRRARRRPRVERLQEELERQAAENSRLHALLGDRGRLLEQLNAIDRSIATGRALPEVLDAIVGAAHDLLGADAVVVRLRRGAAVHTQIFASRGAGHRSVAEGRPADRATGLAEEAIASGEPVERAERLEGGEGDPRRGSLSTELGAPGIRRALAAPIFEGSAATGALVAGRRNPDRRFKALDRQVLVSLAQRAGLALNHARAVEEAMHRAFTDTLTGLPNRTLLLDRLGHAVERSQRTGAAVALMLCDLDRFGAINQALGEQQGDLVLAEVAGRLESRLRASDTLARIGADEFAVLLERLDDPGDAAGAANRVLDGLALPVDAAGREVRVETSAGLAVAAEPDPDVLLRDASAALERARARGGGTCELHEPSLHGPLVERLELELDLAGAIDRDELHVCYQPVVDLEGGEIVAMEALSRWTHPRRGAIPPATFVPVAERSGQIEELGRWVLSEACRQLALWRARYPAYADLQMGVNVSGVQLRDPGFVTYLRSALEAVGLEPGALTVEITETLLMEDTDAASRHLEELKELGVQLAVDDFGVGYSSLPYLRRFPLDNLKLERFFVAELAGPDPAEELVRTILELARIFDLRAVAEGIEEPEQADRLRRLGCRLGQGFLFSEPVRAPEADALLLRSGLLGGEEDPSRRPSRGSDGERGGSGSNDSTL